MPVQTFDAEGTGINQFRRLSASQVIAWNSCPRMWYYGWEKRLKGPLPPQIIRGNAAESCISRVLQESPVLISAESDIQLIPPLDEKGKVDYEDTTNWLAQRLTPISADDWPNSRESIREWAINRVDFHFDRCWNAAVKDWERSPNRSGSVDDITTDECREMIISGIDLHLDEVENCIKASGGPLLDSWRKGQNRPEWPAPDGFPRVWNNPHPAVQESGEISWCEAWEIARPWFVEPDAVGFSQTTCHPAGWFQGEYDLVYRWDGNTRIIDIKASIGKGDRSFGYLDQLRLYAWLWWETHGRSEEVTSLAIWYLGTGTVKHVSLPTVDEMKEYDSNYFELYTMIRQESPELDDCPVSPSPLHIFNAGGIPADPAIDSDSNARCRRCDYRGICENGNHDLQLTTERRLERFGHAWPITPLGEIKPRVDAIGQVVGLSGPELLEDGTIKLQFRIQDGYDRAKVQPAYNGGPRKITRGLIEGSRVRVSNALPSLWRGEVQLNLDEKSEVSIADDEESAPVVEIETRVNVIGRVWSIDAFPDGIGTARWAATLLDATGSAAIVAFKQFIPISAAAIQRGDTIAVLNGEKGEWNGRPQVKIGPGTKVVIISDAEDNPEF